MSAKSESECQVSLLAVCAFEEKSLSQGPEKVVFPGFGTCPCGSVSNLKGSLILARFAWPTQAGNASDTCTVCSLIKTEKLNHCVGWCVGHLCYSQDSEGFNLTWNGGEKMVYKTIFPKLKLTKDKEHCLTQKPQKLGNYKLQLLVILYWQEEAIKTPKCSNMVWQIKWLFLIEEAALVGSVHLENVVCGEQTPVDCPFEKVLACTEFFSSFGSNLLL